ncbi:hypothetical protein TRVL_02684 [Trypanosoma vivax]|nr:hypothetical protein TRVL_02684 [Trypanosoma vivax]
MENIWSFEPVIVNFSQLIFFTVTLFPFFYILLTFTLSTSFSNHGEHKRLPSARLSVHLQKLVILDSALLVPYRRATDHFLGKTVVEHHDSVCGNKWCWGVGWRWGVSCVFTGAFCVDACSVEMTGKGARACVAVRRGGGVQ